MARVQMTIDLTDIDRLDLKIIGDGMVGTLHIEKQGLAYSPPNARKLPESRVPWDRLPQLVAFGNGKP